MSRFRAERLSLGCAPDGAVLLALSAAQPTVLASVAVEHPQNASTAAWCGALQGLAPAPPSPSGSIRLSVTLDDGLVRSFVVTPPRGAQGLRELRASAAARFAVLYGESAEAWLLAADWQATTSFVTCALPREGYQALQQLARTHAWRLQSVSPALVRVWQRVRVSIPADGWLVVGFGRTLTLVHHRSGEVVGLRTLRLPGAPDLAELETLLEQERLRFPVEASTHRAQSLLWTGAAAWLPAVATIAGLASRTIALPARSVEAAQVVESLAAQQLALAGSPR